MLFHITNVKTSLKIRPISEIHLTQTSTLYVCVSFMAPSHLKENNVKQTFVKKIFSLCNVEWVIKLL